MIMENWREIQAEYEKKKPETRFLFVELRRPQVGVVYFEVPEVGLIARFETQDFGSLLQDFMNNEVLPLLAPSPHPTVDIILMDPTREGFATG